MAEDRLREYLKRVTVELAAARQRLAEMERQPLEPIAVVGMACRYPGGAGSAEGLWQLLSDGTDVVGPVPPSRWDVDEYYDEDRSVVGGVYTKDGAFLTDIEGFDPAFFGVSPLEALRMDPQQRLLMELLWEVMEDAGAPPASLAGSRTGVMVGLMDTVQYGRLEMERCGIGVVADPLFGQGVSTSVAAGRLAYHYDLRGPALTIDTACSSSLVAVHLAAEALRRGECERAVAGGAHLVIRPDTFVQGCATSMLAPDGRCKTFDARADGYVLGEGGGLVLLERLSTALAGGRRIRAVLRGSAINQDGRSNGLTAPSRGAQVDVIRRALAAARVSAEDVDFLEAHGSGTHLGDAIELAALHDVFGAPGNRRRDRPLWVGAVKTALGHTQAAAGVAGLIKTVLVLENATVPANLNLTTPSEAIPTDGTVRPAVEPVRLPDDGLAGVSSFGWSGTNAHVVVESAPAVAPGTDATGVTGPYVLPLSAATEAALRARAADLAAWLGLHPTADLADVAHTLQHGRAGLLHRRAIVCTDRDDAIRQLGTASAGGVPGVVAATRPAVAYLLPGTGDQYSGLGRDLYRSEPVYAAAVDECLVLLDGQLGADLRALFFPEDDQPDRPNADLAALLGRTGEQPDPDPLTRAEVAHPYLFTVEYALARLLEHVGVRPDLLVGYSLGEYVAACLAGVLSLPDALHVVVERARLIGSTQPGAMVAVAAGEQEVRAAIATARAGADIAALNGPAMTVVSGPAAEVERVVDQLRAEGLAWRPVRSAHAFHSSLLAPAREDLRALVGSVPTRPPATTIVSNATGTALTPEQATSASYWADHMVDPIRFADAVRYCLDRDVRLFVELGPGQTLGGLVRQNLAGHPGVDVLGTLPAPWLPRNEQEAVTGLAALPARLWEHGVDVTWPRVGRVISLPTYPFERTAFWPEDVPGGATHPSRRAGAAESCYAPVWRQDVVRRLTADGSLPGPLVVFADPGGVGTRLADLVAATGTPVIEVVPGTGLHRDGQRVVIDPAEPEHYRAVFSGLPRGGPVSVVHAWSLVTAGSDDGPDQELRAALRNGFDSLLLAVQGMGELPTHRDVRLLTVSRGSGQIVGGDTPAPHGAAVHGLGRVVQHEYRAMRWRGVDLDPTGGDAGELAAELLDEEGPSLTGWRRGRRWIHEWAELPLPEGPAPWRRDGVYLITGGTRGLGMSLARHLATAGVRGLALVGRRAVDPGQADVAGLKAAGVEVLLLTADVGEPDQLRAALRACRAHFGALHGVVHAAGVPASGMVRRATPADAASVLAPKVLAMGPLAELVGPDTPEQDRLDLLVLYSSAVTAFGGIGEGDYCAANSVLDAYGSALAASSPSTQVVSVAWGPWAHDAWQGGAGGLAERARAYRERFGFTDAGGCALLDRILAAGHGSVVAVRQPLEDARREFAAMVDLDALMAGGPVVSAAARFPRPQLRTAYAEPRTELQSTVAEAWQAYLGIDRVGVDDPFLDLGGNSLIGMAMVLALERALSRQIAPALLFEHPTVAAFAAALEDPRGSQDLPPRLLTTSTARGQRRRRARSGHGDED